MIINSVKVAQKRVKQKQYKIYLNKTTKYKDKVINIRL